MHFALFFVQVSLTVVLEDLWQLVLPCSCTICFIGDRHHLWIGIIIDILQLVATAKIVNVIFRRWVVFGLVGDARFTWRACDFFINLFNLIILISHTCLIHHFTCRLIHHFTCRLIKVFEILIMIYNPISDVIHLLDFILCYTIWGQHVAILLPYRLTICLVLKYLILSCWWIVVLEDVLKDSVRVLNLGVMNGLIFLFVVYAGLSLNVGPNGWCHWWWLR